MLFQVKRGELSVDEAIGIILDAEAEIAYAKGLKSRPKNHQPRRSEFFTDDDLAYMSSQSDPTLVSPTSTRPRPSHRPPTRAVLRESILAPSDYFSPQSNIPPAPTRNAPRPPSTSEVADEIGSDESTTLPNMKTRKCPPPPGSQNNTENGDLTGSNGESIPTSEDAVSEKDSTPSRSTSQTEEHAEKGKKGKKKRKAFKKESTDDASTVLGWLQALGLEVIRIRSW